MPKPVVLNGLPKPSTGEVTITAQKTRSGEIIIEKGDTQQIELEDSESLINPAYTATELHITKNMDNYESLKVGITVTSPCRNTRAAKIKRAEIDLQIGLDILAKEAEALGKEWF